MDKKQKCKQECAEKRARAERIFNEVVDELAGCCPLLPEHVEIVRNTPVELASEEVPLLETALEGIEGVPPDVLTEMLTLEEAASLDFCRMKLSFFRDHDFAYWFYGGTIIIGQAGERFADEKYKRSMAAELGHAISHTAWPFRGQDSKLDLGVSEFYDYAFTSLYEPEAGISEMIRHSRLASLCRAHSQHSSSPLEAARKAVPEAMAVISPDSPPITGEDAEFVDEFQDVVLDIFSVYDNDQTHTDGLVIMWEVLDEVSSILDCSHERAMLYLPHLACNALYDNAVDLSSPEAFVETVKARLPEYLNNG